MTNYFFHPFSMVAALLVSVVSASLCFTFSALNCLAADKNGLSPNAISLPKGPGSIEGLGESFQPSLNSGTAHYSIGFKPPPGTAGHTPGFSLSYEGGASSDASQGWRIRD